MAQYEGMVLTKKGLQLIAKSQLGVKIEITKILIGDGFLGKGETIEDLTAMINPKMTLSIQGVTEEEGGQVKLKAIISNEGIEEGFFVREIGVMAKEEGGEEILYSYTNAGEFADYLPSKGVNLIEDVVEIYSIVGNAENVIVNINDRITLATKEDIEAHNKDAHAHETIATEIDLYVDNNSKADKEDGSQDYPYKSIQTAIDKISRFCKYATLYISDGVYNENVNIEKKPNAYIRMRSISADKTKVIVSSLHMVCVGGTVIDNITFNGVNSEESIIMVSRLQNAIIRNVSLIGTKSKYGLLAYGATVLLADSSISDCEYAVESTHGSLITATNVSGLGNEIAFRASSGIIIYNNATTIQATTLKQSIFSGLVVSEDMAYRITNDETGVVPSNRILFNVTARTYDGKNAGDLTIKTTTPLETITTTMSNARSFVWAGLTTTATIAITDGLDLTKYKLPPSVGLDVVGGKTYNVNFVLEKQNISVGKANLVIDVRSFDNQNIDGRTVTLTGTGDTTDSYSFNIDSTGFVDTEINPGTYTASIDYPKSYSCSNIDIIAVELLTVNVNFYMIEKLTFEAGEEITDSWAEIKANVDAGEPEQYAVGSYKKIDLNGEEVVMEVAGINTYTGQDQGEYGVVKKHIDWISRDALITPIHTSMFYDCTSTTIKSVDHADSKYLNNTIYALIPDDLKNVISDKVAYLSKLRYSLGASAEASVDSSVSYIDAGISITGYQNIGKIWAPFVEEILGICKLTYESIDESRTKSIWVTIFFEAKDRQQYEIFKMAGQNEGDDYYYRTLTTMQDNFGYDYRGIGVNNAVINKRSKDIRGTSMYALWGVPTVRTPMCFRILQEVEE